MSEKILSMIDQLRIFEVPGQVVVLDSDLAAIYGVGTKVFNQAIRRNAARFPVDFLIRLTAEEWKTLRSQIVTLEGSGLRSQFVTSSSHGGGPDAPIAVKHGISAKSVAEQAAEAVDEMLALLGETRPEEKKSRDLE